MRLKKKKLLRKETKNPPKEDKCKYIKDVY